MCQVRAQSDYRFHSVFMYNFTKYIQWPASAQSGDFVIGVLGNSAIIIELEKMATNKLVGSQKIHIKKFKNVAEVTNCQMLFIPSTDSRDFESALEKLKGKSTLVLTEKNGLGQKGSGINFVLVEGKWRFELNEQATQSAGLKVSKELTRLAIVL
ncbi:MAG: YfiR family protein [Bacteroidota bacterium]